MPQRIDICERTFLFGVKVVHFVSLLPRTTAGIAIANQLIRSGTSIGANCEEAQNSGTKKEFVHTFTIALKEARETEYWLRTIKETKLINNPDLIYLLQEVSEIIKILTTIIKNTKTNVSK